MRAMGLWLALWAAPALAAGDDLAEMNAVSRAWDRYAELVNANKPESADLLAASSFTHFTFLRDAALYASADQLRRLPSDDRIKAYLLRATQDEAALKKMDGVALARLFASKGWISVRSDEEDGPVSLTHVTISGDHAVSELGPPTESNFQFGPDFVREKDGWKYRLESSALAASAAFDQSATNAGVTSTQMTEFVLGRILEAEPPRLAVLDRAPVDDAAARIRLNEQWPDYDSVFRFRVEALWRKAEAEDGLAQLALGSMMLDENPQYVQRDPKQALEWLERASNNGNTRAAMYTAGLLMQDPSQFGDALYRRVLPHLQRAANASNGMAMVELSHFYAEGLAGLPQDCRQAADWQARAEEAGVEHARNEQVWTLATCPVPGQRDPARALELARFMIERKDKLSSGELDTVAAAFAANGKFEQAVAYQTEAVAKAPEEYTDRKALAATLKRMKGRLSDYRKGRDYVLDYSMYEQAKAESR